MLPPCVIYVFVLILTDFILLKFLFHVSETAMRFILITGTGVQVHVYPIMLIINSH